MLKPRIKLLTPWVGKPPDYARDFARRVEDVDIVDWSFLWYDTVEQLNGVVCRRLKVPCLKFDGYCLSDVRPMLAEVFPQEVEDYEWWGWVELDVVLGDLDRLLPPLLDANDAVSCFPGTVSGPLMLFRNTPRCNDLFRAGDWKTVLAEPSYCNFEEVAGAHVAGFHKDGGMTKLLRESGLRVHWDDRFSLKDDPTAGCRLDGNRLLETPGGRELLIYHFNHTKRWPL